jgi:hypothetical protein
VPILGATDRTYEEQFGEAEEYTTAGAERGYLCGTIEKVSHPQPTKYN